MISFNGNHVCFVVIYAVAEQVIIPLLGPVRKGQGTI